MNEEKFSQSGFCRNGVYDRTLEVRKEIDRKERTLSRLTYAVIIPVFLAMTAFGVKGCIRGIDYQAKRNNQIGSEIRNSIEREKAWEDVINKGR